MSRSVLPRSALPCAGRGVFFGRLTGKGAYGCFVNNCFPGFGYIHR